MRIRYPEFYQLGLPQSLGYTVGNVLRQISLVGLNEQEDGIEGGLMGYLKAKLTAKWLNPFVLGKTK